MIMTTLDQLKADLQRARINKNAFESDTLRTLIGDVELTLTRPNSDTVDKVVASTVASFIKNAKICSDKADNDAIKLVKTAEIEIYLKYIPKQMTIDELTTVITNQFGNVLDAKQKGVVMGYLKTTFSGQYDGASASQVVNTLVKV